MGPPPSTDIGPGIGAFIAFMVMGVLLWLLMRNMNARMRRMAYRERDRVEALRAPQDARSGEQGDGVPGSGPSDPGSRASEKSAPGATTTSDATPPHSRASEKSAPGATTTSDATPGDTAGPAPTRPARRGE